jgi:hypothetical protein
MEYDKTIDADDALRHITLCESSIESLLEEDWNSPDDDVWDLV